MGLTKVSPAELKDNEGGGAASLCRVLA